MGKFENFKQKVKENKGKIIATSVTVAGVVGVIVWQGDKIKNLQAIVAEQQGDIDLLKDVMDGTVLASLKETLMRKIRYAETKLANGLADGVMSQADELRRREEIEIFSAQLAKVLEAQKHFEIKVPRD
jgi:hypothetical protein